MSHINDGRPTRSIGRRVGVVALLLNVAYIIWRAGWSWRVDDGSVMWWLAVPALAIELTGLLAVSLLIWALAKGRGASRPAAADPGDQGDHVDHVVAVRADGCTSVQLRATLVALRLDPTATDVVVVDHRSRSEFAAIADEFGARYTTPTIEDTSGLAAVLACVDTDWILLLEAGDVPARGVAQRLRRWATDDTVAAVQGVVAAAVVDSAEHGPTGRHDLTFERESLNPALGVRGSAFVSGSATLIRRSACHAIELPQGPRCTVLWGLTGRFNATGRRVVAADDGVAVTSAPLATANEVADNRSARASAAWQLIVGSDGALRAVGLTVTQRLALAAWAVRPTEAIRRVALAAVVLAALLAGRAPFQPVAWAILGLWLPSLVLAGVSILLLSERRLRPGDRLRDSVRSVRVAVVLVVAVNSILMVRGISDRFTHALRPMDHSVQIGLILISLWLLAGCLDSLRLLARRNRSRRAPRVAASAPGSFRGGQVGVADVTMLGAGLLADCALDIGSVGQLTFTLSDGGSEHELKIPAIVRNVRLVEDGSWRIGVEFDHPPADALNVLAECCVVAPTAAAIASFDFDPSDTDDLPRLTIRLATMLALAGVISSAMPVGALAGPSLARQVRGVLIAEVSDEAPVDTSAATAADLSGHTVVGACSNDAGADGVFGTADDTYGSSVSTVTDVDGSYQLTLDGEACWLSIAPPVAEGAPADGSAFSTVSPPMPVAQPESGVVEMPPVQVPTVQIQVEAQPAVTSRTADTTIHDVVWDDRDGDGRQRAGEPGIAGATVTLYDDAGRAVENATTAATGTFTFEHVAVGRYQMGVSNLPTGLRASNGDVVRSVGEPLVVTARSEQLTGVKIAAVAVADANVSVDAPLPQPRAEHIIVPVEPHFLHDWWALLVIGVSLLLGVSLLFASARSSRGLRRIWQ